METKARKRQKARVRSMLNYYKNLGYEVDFDVLNLSTQKLAKITSKHIRGESNKWFHTIKSTGLQVPIKEWNKFARDLKKAKANAKKYYSSDIVDIKDLSTTSLKGFRKLAKWTEKRTKETFFSTKDNILLENFKYMLKIGATISPYYLYLKESILQKGDEWILTVLKANIKDVHLVLFFIGYHEEKILTRNIDNIFNVFGVDPKLENDEFTLYEKKSELTKYKNLKKKYKNVDQLKYNEYKDKTAKQEKKVKDYYRNVKNELYGKGITQYRKDKMEEKYKESWKKLKDIIKK